jgi:hypothetical protein
MQQPLAHIFQTLFQDEVFLITPTLDIGSRHAAMVTRSLIFSWVARSRATHYHIRNKR